MHSQIVSVRLKLILLTCVFLCNPQLWAIELVKNFKPACKIVIPAKPLPVVTYAARELQYHIQKSSKAKLDIVSESKLTDYNVPLIFLGNCKHTITAGIDTQKLPPNAFIIEVTDNRLYIAGKDSPGSPFKAGNLVGTLFGVYEFLEQKLGVRWLWPGELGEVIPEHKNILIAPWKFEYKPQLLHSRVRVAGGFLKKEHWSNEKERNKYVQKQNIFLKRHRFAEGVTLNYGHGFTKYWKRFKDTNRNFFNLLPDGSRRSDPYYCGGRDELISLCVSEPKLGEQIVADWQKTRTPQKPWVNCIENDTNGKCMCSKCLQWDQRDPADSHQILDAKKAFQKKDPKWPTKLGPVSDRYAKFYLAVQKEAQKIDPDATVIAYAYANYSAPPTKIKLNKNIIFGIVPGIMYPWTPAKSERFRKRWSDWNETGARLYLRPNYTIDGHNMPIYYAEQFGKDFAYAYKRGMVATDFDSLTGQWANQGPNLYVLMRVHRHGDWDVNKILDEYYSNFGSAENAVRKYFEYWKEISQNAKEEQFDKKAKSIRVEGGYWASFYQIADCVFTPEVMDKGGKLLEKAKLQAKGDPIAEARVAFLEKGFQDACLTLKAEKAFREYKATGNISVFATAVNILDKHRDTCEKDCVMNRGYLGWAEGRKWDRSAVKFRNKAFTELTGPWKFMWDPKETGEEQKWFAVKFDDSKWHDISTKTVWEKQPVGKAYKSTHGQDYDGKAWYRLKFDIDEKNKKKRCVLYFGAVDEACSVWLNGHLLMRRPYPYKGDTDSWRKLFKIDVSKFIRYGQANTLAVCVEDKAGAGGIWKPVYLHFGP